MAATRRVLLSAIFGIAAFASAGGAFAADDAVQLGILAPLTGGAAADGEEMVRGAMGQLVSFELFTRVHAVLYNIHVIDMSITSC